MDFVMSFIAEHFGVSVFVGIFTVVLFVFLIWWACGLWYKFKNLPCEDHAKRMTDYKEVTEKVNHLPCSRMETAAASLESRIRTAENSMNKIEGLIIGLYKLLPNTVDSDLSLDMGDMSKKHSPRQLNDNGNKLFDEIGGQAFLTENRERLFATIDKLAPKTALDVEMLSFTALRLNSDNESFNRIKNWVYVAPIRDITDDNGTVKKKDVTLDTVLFVLSIPLRDMYLEAHPGLLRI